MKETVKQKLTQWNKTLVWVACLHWAISFFLDQLVFSYVIWDLSDLKQIIKTAMTYGAKAVFLVVLILLYQGAYAFWKNHLATAKLRRESRPFVTWTLTYFAINMVILLCIWPGIWRMDEFGILNSAVQLLPVFWQNYLTSLFYIFAMMLLPFPTGVIIVQCACISLAVGAMLTYMTKAYGKLGLLVGVPFLFFPTLDSNAYPMRMCIYGFLELLLVFLLYKKIRESEGNKKNAKSAQANNSLAGDSDAQLAQANDAILDDTATVCATSNDTPAARATASNADDTQENAACANLAYWLPLCTLAAIVTAWRTEAVYYFVLFPLLLFILFTGTYGKKAVAKIAGAYLIIALCLYIPQTLGDKLTSGNNYDLTSVLQPLLPLVTAADADTPFLENELLQSIDAVIDVEAALDWDAQGKRGISLYWNHPEVVRDYTDAEYTAFKSAYYSLILKYPGVFLQERWYAFVNCTGLLGDTTAIYSDGSVDNYTTFLSYPLTDATDVTLRKNVISILEWRDTSDYDTTLAGYGIIYSALPPIVILLVVTLTMAAMRKWKYFFLLALPLVRVPLVFLTAPSDLFMYYYSIYLIGYVLIFFIVTRLIYNCRSHTADVV